MRAALAALDRSRHTVIYLPDPTVGVRGIHHRIVASLDGRLLTHHATLAPMPPTRWLPNRLSAATRAS